MIFRQLFDQGTWTYTYLLADPQTKEAVLIDTVVEQVDRDLQLVHELGLDLVYVLDTHVHADHVTGSGQIRERTQAKTVVNACAGVACADVQVSHGDELSFGAYKIEVRSTPGHTDGCLTYVVRDGDKTMAFTGDALLIRGCGRTDFQQGSAHKLYRSVHEQIFSLPDDTYIYPGHDYQGQTVSTVREEKDYNLRLADSISEDRFVQIMGELDLAQPKRIDVAVPANLTCGIVQMAGGGLQEVAPLDVTDLSKYTIVDVREPEEFDGPLGHLEGATLVPLATVPKQTHRWSPNTPLLIVCRGGVRSKKACEIFASKGFSNVTNLKGGMMAWRETR